MWVVAGLVWGGGVGVGIEERIGGPLMDGRITSQQDAWSNLDSMNTSCWKASAVD